MKIDDVTVIIPVRKELDLFELNLKILRKQYPNIKLICSLDDVGDDKKRYDDFKAMSETYSFKYISSKTRDGLVTHIPNMVKMVTTDVVSYFHADNIVGEKCLENMLKHVKDKTIVSATRIEPPLHPPQPKVKIIRHLGMNADDFNEDKFNKIVSILLNQYSNKTTGGIFAPHMFLKKDWLDYDPVMSPQSLEDSCLWRTMLQKGYKFIQSWDAFVYHFTCRGSRYAEKIGTDSKEWELSNRKNTKNYIRLHNSEPLYTDTQSPFLAPKVNVDAIIIPDSNCTIKKTLSAIEPYFQSIYVYGKDNKDKIKKEINSYCEVILSETPTNFNRKKIQFIDTDEDYNSVIRQIKDSMESDYLCVLGNYPINQSVLNNFRFTLRDGKKALGFYLNKKNPAYFILHKSISWTTPETVELDDRIDIQAENRLEYINKHGTTPERRETFTVSQKVKKRQSIGLGIIQKGEEYLIENLIWKYEPYFDEIAILTDGDNCNKMFEFVSNYCEKTQGRVMYNVLSKFKLKHREMNADFAKQRNVLSDMMNTDYIMQLDADELFDTDDIDLLHDMVESLGKGTEKCILFPRQNYIDGVQTKAYPDYQGRLYKNGAVWINKYPFTNASPGCHEQLDCMYTHAIAADNVPLQHIKTHKKQVKQNVTYKNSWKLEKFPTNILYDSVLYTNEGITYHAKKEIEKFIEQSYKVKTIEPWRDNDEYSEVLKHANAQFAVNGHDYLTIINQPPTRWSASYRYHNIIPYLAFEGQPPDEWVKLMNGGHINRILVPSTYNKTDFIEAGVTTPISVVPHGVDMDIWKPNKPTIKNKPFTVLAGGAVNSQRKGLDITIRTFCKAFKSSDNVQLILKVNKIYNPKMNVNDFIAKHATPEMLDKIVYIDYDMSERDMVELFNVADLFVSSSHSEGFSLMPLQAMACKTPVMVTNGGGHLDYCSADNCLLIPVTDKPYHPKYKFPYTNATWFNIDEDAMVKQLKKAKSMDMSKMVKCAYETAKEFSWENTLKIMKEKLMDTENNNKE